MKQEAANQGKREKVSLIICGILTVAMLVCCAAFFISYYISHTFTQERWLEHPESRAKMTDHLLAEHDLKGLTEQQVLDLLGPNDNDMGYFQKDNRYVYCLGGERLIIDNEWLVLDFENGVVSEYAITQD